MRWMSGNAEVGAVLRWGVPMDCDPSRERQRAIPIRIPGPAELQSARIQCQVKTNRLEEPGVVRRKSKNVACQLYIARSLNATRQTPIKRNQQVVESKAEIVTRF
jgi:hypothetical protein